MTLPTNMSRAIAIDGPAASGKSSAARILSQRLNLIMVNSGAMYRAVAWNVRKHGIDLQDKSAILALLESDELQCGVDENFSTVGFGSMVLSDELKSEEVNTAVSHIAKIPEVREILLKKQRSYLEIGDVVMEGRDIGTVVFPETPYKFFFQASEDVRQARRNAEGLKDSIAERDKHDSNRKIAPLLPASDAILIETGNYDLMGVVELVISHLTELGW